MDNGKMTKNGAWEHKLILTHQYIKVLLGVINEKEKESIRMQTEINIKGIGWMVLNMGAEDIYQKILSINIMAILFKISRKALVRKNFLTEINIKEIIWGERCMGMEYLNGETETNTMVNGLTDRNVDRVS